MYATPEPDVQARQTLQDTSQSLWYSFTINFTGREKLLEEIVTYDCMEALGVLQSHKAPYWSHKAKTLIYLDVLIVQVRPTVYCPLMNLLSHSSWMSHSRWSVWELLENFSFLQSIWLACSRLVHNLLQSIQEPLLHSIDFIGQFKMIPWDPSTISITYLPLINLTGPLKVDCLIFHI